MIDFDLWRGDDLEKVDKITVFFYPNDGEYRGNLFIKGQIVGDFVTSDSLELEKAFPQLNFKWD